MEKEVVVAADVDEEEELSKVFKFVNLLWLHGLIDGETLESARKISSQYQGYHEHEVSVGGEADLFRHYVRCKKNPGHSQFIPFQDFKLEHLPPSHFNKFRFEVIKAEADLTCRLVVSCVSANRPKYHPGRKHLLYPFSKYRDIPMIRTGTGRVGDVEKYTDEDNKNCECDKCNEPGTHTPHKVWGKVYIYTATHVVYDDDEARRTACHFGYDTKTTLLHKCLKLTGPGLRFAKSQVIRDWSMLTYVTHDMDIVNKLYKMVIHRNNVWTNMVYNDGHSKNSDLSPVVIISHPHGCSKHITVGIKTHRQTWGETHRVQIDGVESDQVLTSYTYNAHTCPGSSGAPVIGLPEKGKWWLWTTHPHSEAGEGNTNNNKSVVHPESVSPQVKVK